LDIVTVGDRRAEHAHHGVADVLVDCATPARDHRVGELEVAREQSMRFLRIERARKPRVPGEVGKQDRRLTQLARRGCCDGGHARLAIDRINESSVVTGPFLIAVGIAWWLRDQYRVSWNLVIPSLLVILGVLMLIARNPRVPDKRSKTTTPP